MNACGEALWSGGSTSKYECRELVIWLSGLAHVVHDGKGNGDSDDTTSVQMCDSRERLRNY